MTTLHRSTVAAAGPHEVPRVRTTREPSAPSAEQQLDAYAVLAAHQMGEAVTLLRGYTAQLQAESEHLPPALGDAVRGIGVGVERAQRFVDDLLDLKAAGSAEIADDRVDLNTVLTRARAALADALARPGIELSAGRLPRVRGSAALLERLLVHLLRAALAARVPGGLRIEVDGDVDRGQVTIEVRDDGVALDAELAARAFEPFVRGRGRGPLIGAGVSSAICRRIVERHGGTIEARPREGAGAVVTVTLPRAA